MAPGRDAASRLISYPASSSRARSRAISPAIAAPFPLNSLRATWGTVERFELGRVLALRLWRPAEGPASPTELAGELP